MRLRKQDDHWTPLFTVLWEVERLADAGDRWLPFALPLTPDQPLGEIHAHTHQIRFFADEPQQHTLAVSLCMA